MTDKHEEAEPQLSQFRGFRKTDREHGQVSGLDLHRKARTQRAQPAAARTVANKRIYVSWLNIFLKGKEENSRGGFRLSAM